MECRRHRDVTGEPIANSLHGLSLTAAGTVGCQGGSGKEGRGHLVE